MDIDIGKRIRELRNYLNLTQKEFSEKISISRSHLSGIESGKETLSDSVIKLICIEFQISEIWLRKGEGEKTVIGGLHLNKNEYETNIKNPLIEISNILRDATNLDSQYVNITLDNIAMILRNNTIPAEFYSSYLEIITYIFTCICSLISSVDKRNNFSEHNYITQRIGIEEGLHDLYKLFIKINDKKVP